MKKNLQNQLKAYSLLVGGAIAMPEAASAQTVTYNDFADQTLDVITNPTNQSYTLDVNSDGVNDIIFNAAAYNSSSGKGGSFYASALTNATILTTPLAPAVGGWATRPEIVESPTQICKALTNYGSNGLILIGNSVGGFAGAWKGKDAYMGFRVKLLTASVVTDTLYGWVRMEVFASGKITIKSAAYTNDDCITAGATTTTGVLNNAVQSDAVVFTNQNNEIVVRIPNGVVLNNEQVEVIDMNGNTIYSGTFNGNETIIKSAYKNGMYMVRVTSDNVMYSGKVVLK